MEIGLRVVRGPDWTLEDSKSDGGEGFVGTVVEVGGKSSSLPKNLVWVQWDTGIRLNHRAGYYGAYDLCVLDSAPVGVKHDGLECHSCQQSPILGMCWKCLDCGEKYCLCSACYNADEHDRKHSFLRVEFPDSPGVSVGTRSGARRIKSKGIFPGAKVVRGQDWNWTDQDGGEGKEGVVIELKNWKRSPKQGVLVSWDMAEKQKYRLGAKGKVDLKCIKPGSGGFYYKDHLPKMGECKNKAKKKKTDQRVPSTSKSSDSEETGSNKLVVGDSVCVILPADIVRAMNEGIEEWSDANNKYIGRVGTLDSMSSSGRVSILYSDNRILTFHPDLVTKADKEASLATACSTSKFQNGAVVKIMEDAETLRKLQQGHGPWNESVCQARGKQGKVLDVTVTGDIEVIVEEGNTENVIVFNPDALSSVESETLPQNSNQLQNPLETIKYGEEDLEGGFLARLLGGDGGLGMVLCHAAGGGDVNVVEGILDRSPNLVDYSNERTQSPLIRACVEGNTEVVTVLLSRGASIHQQDHQGYAALHHAAHRDMSGSTARVLIAFGANVNDNRNGTGNSPLHLAVKELNTEVAHVLLEAGCDRNLLDRQGFTPLHYAANGDMTGIAAGILTEGGADVNDNRNSAMLTPLHLTAREHNLEAAKFLIKAGCNLNLQEVNGNTALHEALQKGNLPVAEALLELPSLNLIPRNGEGLTSFHLAIIKQFRSLALKILRKAPDVATIPGMNGMTTLHFAALYEVIDVLQELLDMGVVSMDVRNSNGLTALELATAANQSSAVEVLKRRIKGSAADIPDQSSESGDTESTNEGLPGPRNQVSCEFRFGDRAQINENRHVVEAFQLGHGGWNPGMNQFVGQTGFIEEVLDTGDVRISIPVVSESFSVPFIFNPRALVRFVSREPSTSDTEKKSEDSKASETATRPPPFMEPFLEYVFLIQQFVDLIINYQDIIRDIERQSVSKVLLMACKMRWLTKVKEILRKHPRVVNQKEGNTFVLHVCCFDADPDVVKLLLTAGADINLRDRNGFAPLHAAAMGDKNGHVTKLLLDYGANPNDHENTFCVTALHLAVVRSSEGAAKNLASMSGTNINLQDSNGDSALHCASMLGREEIVSTLLRVDATGTGLFNSGGHLPLHVASKKGFHKIVKWLLTHSEQQVNTLTRNEKPNAAIHLALRNGHSKVVNVLLNVNSLDLRILNYEGRAPKDMVDPATNPDLLTLFNERSKQGDKGDIKQQQLGNTQVMLQKEERNLGNRDMEESKESTENNESESDEVEPNQSISLDRCKINGLEVKGRIGDHIEIPEEMIDALLLAVLTANVLEAEAILTKYPHAINRSYHGYSLVHLACLSGFVEILRLLLEWKAKITEMDENGLTPLHIAVASDKTGATVGLLLDNGADPDLLSSVATKKSSALHFSVLFHNLVATKQLIRRKCNVNIQDGRGITPMELAIDLDKEKLAAEMTNSEKYDPLLRNGDGLNNFHKAIRRRFAYLVKRLLVRSPNIVNEPTEEGDMPIHLAAADGSLGIAKILINGSAFKRDVRDRNGETPCKVALSRGHNQLARLLWGEHDGVELYEQLFAEMAQSEETTDEQMWLELEPSDDETASVEALDIHSDDLRYPSTCIQLLSAHSILSNGVGTISAETKSGNKLSEYGYNRSVKAMEETLTVYHVAEIILRDFIFAKIDSTSLKKCSLRWAVDALSNTNLHLSRYMLPHKDKCILLSDVKATSTEAKACNNFPDLWYNNTEKTMADLTVLCQIAEMLLRVSAPIKVEITLLKDCSLGFVEKQNIEASMVGHDPPVTLPNSLELTSPVPPLPTLPNLREERDSSDVHPPQRPPGAQPSTDEENKKGREEQAGSFGNSEVPDRLLCCICLEKQKNITFQCGHLNTCETCAKKIKECPECKAPITSRLTTYY